MEFAKAYLSAMKSWEERVVDSTEFALPLGDPAGDAARAHFKSELDKLHSDYCEPSEWSNHFMVSSPSWFDVEIINVDKKTRNRFLIHLRHLVHPFYMQLEVRRIETNWRILMMWQSIPETGKRYKCFH